MTTSVRHSARVLLIDRRDRLLLVRSLLHPGQPDRGHAWFTPGGGVEAGEDLVTAAVRELREEIGLDATPADRVPVAFTSGYADLGWVSGVFRDDFFLMRVPSHEVDATGLNDLERRHHGGHRWWTHAELAATTEIVYPNRLAALLADLLVGRAPPAPVELPWHH